MRKGIWNFFKIGRDTNTGRFTPRQRRSPNILEVIRHRAKRKW